MAIDPAQSFSNALGQGLGIMKSYRDETRQDEDRAFAKQVALAQEKRSERSLELQFNEDRRRQVDSDFSVKRQPSILQQDAQAIELGAEQITGVKIDNKYKPEKYKAEINQTNSSADANRANAAQSRVQTRVLLNQDYRAGQDWNDARDANGLVSFLLGKTSSLPNSSGGMRNTPLGFAGHIGAAPRVLSVLQNPTQTGWMNDPQLKAQVMTFAGRGADSKLEEKWRWRKGSAGMVDLAPAGKGRVKALFVGVDAKTGRQTQVWVEKDAGQLFAQANVRARHLGAMGANPQVRRNFVAALQSNPEAYEAFTGRATQLLGMQRKALVKQYTDAETPEDRAAAEKAITKFDTNAGNLIADKTFQLMTEGGQAVAIPKTTRAYAYLTSQGDSTAKAADIINKISENPTVFAKFIKTNGLKPNVNGKPLGDAQIRQLPQWNKAKIVIDYFADQF
jgi:hypothetical protein